MQNQESCYMKISPNTGVPARIRHAYETIYSELFDETLKEAKRLMHHYNIQDPKHIEIRMR